MIWQDSNSVLKESYQYILYMLVNGHYMVHVHVSALCLVPYKIEMIIILFRYKFLIMFKYFQN